MMGQRAYRWGNKYIKPGQVFEAIENEMPKELKLYSIPITNIPTEKTVVPSKMKRTVVEDPVVITYRIKERNGGEYYDILDNKGKKINEGQLNKEDADEMIKALQA